MNDYLAQLNIKGERTTWKNNRVENAKVLKRVKKHIKYPVLEVGVGDGYVTRVLNCDGMDVSSYLSKTLNIIQSDISKEVLYPDKYNTVVSFATLEHVCDIEQAINNIWGYLKVGGKLIITLPIGEKLDNNMVMCPKCNHTFHRMGHFHSFKDISKVKNLLFKFKLIYVKTVSFSFRKRDWYACCFVAEKE